MGSVPEAANVVEPGAMRFRAAAGACARVLSACALCWLVPAIAHAGNGDDFFVGDRAAMTAGAVTATVADGSAGFYNHAGLATVERNRIDVSAAAYALHFDSVHGFLGVRSGPSADASVTEFIAVPTQVAYVRQLGRGVTLGLGYFVPQATNALLSQRLEVSERPGPASTWALDTRESSASSWLTAALGLRLSDTLRLGFGLFGVYDDFVQSIAFFGSVQRDGAPERAIELSDLSTLTRISAAPGVGLQADLARGWTLGLWARGPQLQLIHSEKDSINVVRGGLDAQSALLLDAVSNQVDESGKQVGFVTLGRYAAALAYTYGGTTVSVEVDVEPGLRSARTGVDSAFTLDARAGVTYALTSRIVLGAGLFSDRGREPSSEVSSVDFYGGTLGVELCDLLGLASGERADSLVLSSVFALRYAYGRGRAATLLVDPEADVAALIGDADGRHVAHELAVHVGSGLRF